MVISNNFKFKIENYTFVAVNWCHLTTSFNLADKFKITLPFMRRNFYYSVTIFFCSRRIKNFEHNFLFNKLNIIYSIKLLKFHYFGTIFLVKKFKLVLLEGTIFSLYFILFLFFVLIIALFLLCKKTNLINKFWGNFLFI